MKLQGLFWAVVVASTACGSDDVDLDDFQSELVDAVCKNAVACQDAPDMVTCKAATQPKTREIETLIAKSRAKTITYDSEAARECLDFIASASCSFEGFHRPPSPCFDVFVGTIAAGGACVITEECAGESYCKATDPNCDDSAMCCPGTCTALPVDVAIGGDCTAAPCVDNAYCDATNRCAALITTAGAACTELDACANPMYCDVFSATSPTCVAPAARNATCDPNALLACLDFRDYCDATALKCTQRVAVGTACGGTNGAECIGFADCTNMLCAAELTAGMACTVDSTNCLGDLDCTNSTCTLPPAETACARWQTEPTTSQPPATSRERPIKRTSGFDLLLSPQLRAAR